MGLFGGKSKGSSSSGSSDSYGWGTETDTTVNGSQERPHQDGTRSSTGDLGDGGICRNPSNKIEEQG